MSRYWVGGKPAPVVAKSTDNTGLYRFWVFGQVVVQPVQATPTPPGVSFFRGTFRYSQDDDDEIPPNARLRRMRGFTPYVVVDDEPNITIIW